MRWTLVKFALVKHYSFTDRCWLTDADMVWKQKLPFVYECWHCNEKHTWGEEELEPWICPKASSTAREKTPEKADETLTNSVQISQTEKEGQHNLETGRLMRNTKSWERVEKELKNAVKDDLSFVLGTVDQLLSGHQCWGSVDDQSSAADVWHPPHWWVSGNLVYAKKNVLCMVFILPSTACYVRNNSREYFTAVVCRKSLLLEVISSAEPDKWADGKSSESVSLLSVWSFSHNDLPWQLRKQFNNQLNKVDLNTLNSTHTNIPKIKEGHLGAQVSRMHGELSSKGSSTVGPHDKALQ